MYLNEIRYKVMFDSTHFSNGSLEVKLRIKSNGVWHEDTYSAPVKNYSKNFGKSAWEAVLGSDGATFVHYLMTSIGISSSLIASWQWDYNDIESALSSCTLLYFNTHGNVGIFLDDCDNTIYPTSSQGTPDFLTWRTAVNGSGYPPLNSTGNPPINLAVWDSCLTGTDASFLSSLHPFWNAYGGLIEDQAIAGWKVFLL